METINKEINDFNTFEELQYINLLKEIKEKGHTYSNRTNIDRISINGAMMKFNLENSFPMFTNRYISLKTVIHEILWFISGSPYINYLLENNIHIWDNWIITEETFLDYFNRLDFTDVTDEERSSMEKQLRTEIVNNIGPMYGYMWRNAPRTQIEGNMVVMPNNVMERIPSDKLCLLRETYRELLANEEISMNFEQYASETYCTTIDQLAELVYALRNKKRSSRLILETWIPSLIPDEDLSPQENVFLGRMALAPCHKTFQVFIREEKGELYLDSCIYQRSCDMITGVPFNVAEYALLTKLLAHTTGYKSGVLTWMGGDCHIYSNQLEALEEILSNKLYPFTDIVINKESTDLFSVKYNDISYRYDYLHSVINTDLKKLIAV